MFSLSRIQFSKLAAMGSLVVLSTLGTPTRADELAVVCRADAGVWAPDDEGLRRYEEGPKLIRGTAASATICRGVESGNDRPQSAVLLPLMPISRPERQLGGVAKRP